ncbi:MAG: hypothetical protein RL346_2092 [Verrucomicrobiota bacterium]|jgi:uncharacterized protein YijF (DUF1287 family)
MSRKSSGFYSAIEYIGPRPQRPKKTNFFGGWVILVITLLSTVYFVKPWIGTLLAAQNGPSKKENRLVLEKLQTSSSVADRLAASALKYSNSGVEFESGYVKLPYPNGDFDISKGTATDLVVRCLREVDVDLQQLIHEDMSLNFKVYPQLWQATKTDSSIDHRRVPNLMRYFTRHATVLENSRKAEDYLPGDIVVWALSNAELHIGIVVPSPSVGSKTPWVVHHPAYDTVKWENALFHYQVLGHFRYPFSKKP